MKSAALVAASLLLTAGLAWAQDTAVTPAAAAPDSSAPAAASTPSAEKGKRLMSPEMKEIRDRMKLQEDRIEMGVKNGKLTADEAAALRAKLKSIREEIKADWKQNKANGQKGLTEDQKSQIKADLDANSAAIKDDKQQATPAN